jgi:hypothetical protein
MNIIKLLLEWLLSLFTVKSPVVVSPHPPAKLDPKHGVNTVASVFGSTYKGGVDPTDNGQGAFKDPATGKSYATRNVVGVAIPIPFFKETCGGNYLLVEQRKFTVTIFHNNVWYRDLPIVDLGPGAHGKLLKDKEGHTHLLDRTYPLCKLMNSFDNAEVAFWIVDEHGVSLEVKGFEVGYFII